ncbi:MAG: cyclic nucleotide-binding domain-containing protein [Chrysiogenetes bacterium]|nr:cyclic nucleotide-binding domain-containing protein [Chrysiogenetes bacterium]
MEKTDFLNVFEGLEGSELIQDTFLFEKLNFDEAAGLASQFELRAYEPGQTILEQNAIGESLYLVKSGKVAVIKSDGEHEQQLAELGEGELFGEMSLVETELTSASVRAVGKTECLVLPKFAIEQIMKHDRDFSLKIYQAFCKILSERLRRTTQDLFEARKGR